MYMYILNLYINIILYIISYIILIILYYIIYITLYHIKCKNSLSLTTLLV